MNKYKLQNEDKLLKDTEKILDYWFAIEFLGQDNYEMATQRNSIKKEVSEEKKSLNKNKSSDRRKIKIFTEIKDKEIAQVLYDESKVLNMKSWGNITVYLGKIKRESCIMFLKENLNIDEFDRVEKSIDDIAIASFQLDDRGNYIPNSFSFSTIVWAMNVIKNKSGNIWSEILSEDEYKKEISEIENKFFNCIDNKYKETNTYEAENDENELFENSISLKKLEEIKSFIYDRYIVKTIDKLEDNIDTYDMNIAIKVQLFKDEKAKEKYDEDTYLGLSHDFFSNDIKMVKEYLTSYKKVSKSMFNSLIEYINAPRNFENKNCNRIDVVKPNDKNNFENFLHNSFNIMNSPIGKWPSRYMPSLMQQLAINKVIGMQKNSDDNYFKNIFSVNGPPGTGKTTLIKEIIANNIVEKAKILSGFNKADDAFEANRFIKGEKTNNVYSKYHPKWYSIKDERINNYSILITSCNNAAVENITKELPIEEKLLDSLKSNENDSDKMKDRLNSIAEIFRVSKEDDSLENQSNDNKKITNEVYFSNYAKNLFKKEGEAWGLVAAPLGKKSNIDDFYYKVLNPIHQEHYFKNDNIDAKDKDFQKAKEEFKAQLKKVEKIRDDLSKICDIAYRYKKNIQNYEDKISLSDFNKNKNNKEIEELNKKLSNENKILNDLNFTYENKKTIFDNKKDEFEKLNKKKKDLENNISKKKENIIEIEKSIGFMSKLLKNNKYKIAIESVKSYEVEIKEITEDINNQNKKIKENEKDIKTLKETIRDIENKINKQKRKISDINNRQKKLKNNNNNEDKNIESLKGLIEENESNYKNSIKGLKNADEMNRASVIDEKFIDSLLSNDDELATKAQLSNPWNNEIFNFEREKLLFLALQLTREFLLSSKACRENFILLSQYWGLASGDDNERINFKTEDKKQMVISLYQTLMILVPAISSTFASIGNLLRDVKQTEAFGTLVVDESGQAQPHMAIGAMFRCKKAIIVGDPRQVEPVVSDDLELLKKLYTNDLFLYYKDKSHSVQSFADILNPIGTYLDNGTNYPDWIGCPLLIHRRCISPMYDISNQISYGGMMKQQTAPAGKEKCDTFLYKKSQWFNISGKEVGSSNHYVKNQGLFVCDLLEKAFLIADNPNIYIISPFKTVINGIKAEIKNHIKLKNKAIDNWLSTNIGTVHTFQGKEANEVIFLLGCDESKESQGAVSWVNSNLVNVAVTRAKYRLYIVGDSIVWNKNKYLNRAKSLMDIIPLKNYEAVINSNKSEDEKNKEIINIIEQIPSSTSFIRNHDINDLDGKSSFIDTDVFVNNLEQISILKKELSDEQLNRFGFKSNEQLFKLEKSVSSNLKMAIKLYYILKPYYEVFHDLDASCCGILFCKSLELNLRDNFYFGLKKQFPDFLIGSQSKKIPLKKSKSEDLMIGVVHFIINSNISKLADLTKKLGCKHNNLDWWKEFTNKVNITKNKRNVCCHPQEFKWDDLEKLIDVGYCSRNKKANKEISVGNGVFFESSVGKILNENDNKKIQK